MSRVLPAELADAFARVEQHNCRVTAVRLSSKEERYWENFPQAARTLSRLNRWFPTAFQHLVEAGKWESPQKLNHKAPPFRAGLFTV